MNNRAPILPNGWTLLSHREWVKTCIFRHLKISLELPVSVFIVGAFFYYAIGFLSLLFHWSGLGNFTAYLFLFHMYVLTPLSLIVGNIWYWKQFESIKNIKILIEKEEFIFSVIHLDDEFPLPYFLRFMSDTSHFTNFISRYKQQIIYVQHPHTNEIFGYCRKCHQLMSLEQVQERVCPHCGQKIYYYGPH